MSRRQSKPQHNQKLTLIKEYILSSTQYLTYFYQFSNPIVVPSEKLSQQVFSANIEKQLSQIMVQITCLLLRCFESNCVYLRLSLPLYVKPQNLIMRYGIEEPKPIVYSNTSIQIHDNVTLIIVKKESHILINCTQGNVRDVIKIVCNKISQFTASQIPIKQVLYDERLNKQQWIESLEKSQLFIKFCSLHRRNVYSLLWNSLKEGIYFKVIEKKYIRKNSKKVQKIVYKENKQINKQISQYFENKCKETKLFLKNIGQKHWIYQIQTGEEQQNYAFKMNKFLQDKLKDSFSLKFIELSLVRKKKMQKCIQNQLKIIVYLHTKIIRTAEQVSMLHTMSFELKCSILVDYIKYQNIQKALNIECFYENGSVKFLSNVNNIIYSHFQLNILLGIDTVLLAYCSVENYILQIQKKTEGEKKQIEMQKNRHQKRIYFMLKQLYERNLKKHTIKQ